MSTEKTYTEEELYNDGLQLIANGQRPIFVFKYIRERAADEDMRKRIMERLNANKQVQQTNQVRLEKSTSGINISTTDMIGGGAVLLFAGVLFYYLRHAGWLSLLPIALVVFVFGVWQQRGKF